MGDTLRIISRNVMGQRHLFMYINGKQIDICIRSSLIPGMGDSAAIITLVCEAMARKVIAFSANRDCIVAELD